MSAAVIARIIAVRDTLRRTARKTAAGTDGLDYARGVMATVLQAYAGVTNASVPALPRALAAEAGLLARDLPAEEAAYYLGTIYTVLLPETFRAAHGTFYTPPALVRRLLAMAEAQGIDWARARVCDPACGGGAFLAPVALRMVRALAGRPAEEIMHHLAGHLAGYEVDSFAAWMSQAFLRAALVDLQAEAPQIVTVADTLALPDEHMGRWDLVIGNPPYGRVKLAAAERRRWKSLSGHANLYGLFTEQATRLAAPGGLVAYVTPTSFLGGQYFSGLRDLLTSAALPLEIDLVAAREGVFADAQQETALAVYRRASGYGRLPDLAPGFGDALIKAAHVLGRTIRRTVLVPVKHVTVSETSAAVVEDPGAYALPGGDPWLLPRRASQVPLMRRLAAMPTRLADLGYGVATGPLVWNQHKERLFAAASEGMAPVIWSDCVAPDNSGGFRLPTPGAEIGWYAPRGEADSNIVWTPCVLLQRTTSAEQRRRLVAAVLPAEVAVGGAAVENHVQMVRALPGAVPVVSLQALAALLNSAPVDEVFRCLSGSVAVSAYELQAMPLPPAEDLLVLEALVRRGADAEEIETAVREMYSIAAG